MQRITAAAPDALTYEANQLAMCLGQGPADANTFVGLGWQDASGNLYSAASWEATDQWIIRAQEPLVRPDWDTDYLIDMPAAEAAQAAMVFSTEPIPATPTQITAVTGDDGPAMLAAMGLIPAGE
nr:MAG TPA_asm: hypothetical protein [Bacteriophage sp.]